jgi:carbonic anhydrase
MRLLNHIFENNRKWSETIRAQRPDFFERLAHQQTPELLWIGCSDSRVPANEVIGLMPGEVFVHRNVANVVVHTDLNCLSVIQYAVDVLHIRHIIVCGHYGCGGIQAALSRQKLGLIDNWLRHVQDVRHKHAFKLDTILNPVELSDRLCELNVIEQVLNVCQTTVVQDAWLRGQPVAVHGWIYGLRDGRLNDLKMCVTRAEELADAYAGAISNCLA